MPTIEELSTMTKIKRFFLYLLEDVKNCATCNWFTRKGGYFACTCKIHQERVETPDTCQHVPMFCIVFEGAYEFGNRGCGSTCEDWMLIDV